MPKVLIAVPTGESAKYSNFYDFYNQLERVDGTLHMFARGQSPAKNRNMCVQAAIDNECTHIFFLDDDVIPPKDSLQRLLTHDKDVVTGLYPMRNFPHYPVIFNKRFANGYNKHVNLSEQGEGLIEITNCGFGCVLIKMEVFRKLPKPWVTLGELEADGWCDDIAFFNKVVDAGFKMYCDLTLQVDHMMTVHAGFRRVNDKWMVQYDCRGQGNVQFPITYPSSDTDMAKRIEGWMSDKELDFLGVAAKSHKNILEIGSYKGKSARVFADNTDGTVVCIDPWNAFVFSSTGKIIYETNDNTYIEFQKNLKEHIESEKVIPYRMMFSEYEPNGFKPDFIFIDAAHDYESVKHDIDKALSMKPKLLAGHDYDPNVWPGVVKAVDERFNKINNVDTIWWVENE
jgi:hypothetical protein